MSATIVMTLAVPDRTGAARMQAYFAGKLVERGHQVRLIHGPPATDENGREWSLLSEQRDSGIETVLVEALSRPVPYLSYRSIAKAASGATAIIAVNQRDRAAAMAVAARLDVPGIVCAQNQHNFWGRSLLPTLKRKYYQQRILTGMTLAICTSEVVRDELIEFGVKPERCVVLPNGIPVSSPIVDRSERPGDVAEFVSVGRLDIQKGYDVLLDAWHAADLGENARLRIVGGITPGNSEDASRDYARRLREQRNQLGLSDQQVVFEGSRDDIADILGQSDVYVHSARWEGPALPLAIMEAMDSALPIVMTDCSGWPTGFEAGRHGYVVESESVDALAAAISEVAKLPSARWREMGNEARSLLEERYDIARIGHCFVDLVEGAIK